jgi:methylenetetrahydrofolate dehydrogenase (NADP+)/methenyltetrahydrofolate cyclohydrolase
LSARVIDGKAIAAEVRGRVADEAAELSERLGRPPGLATVLVGEDPGSQVYVRNKRKASEEAGMRSIHREFPQTVSQDEVLAAVAELNRDPGVDGILVQLPLPDAIDQDAVIAAIDPAKDVDGLTATNAGLLAQGRPGLVACTPAGVMEILSHEGIEVEGAQAVIVGRSILVGRPLSALLTNASATVTVCHSRTRELDEACRRAEVLIAAVGSPRMVKGDWVKPGATVIDVGINRTDEGLVGDVDFDAAREIAGAITPVPGGVGPMTIAMLLRNTVLAARRSSDGAV